MIAFGDTPVFCRGCGILYRGAAAVAWVGDPPVKGWIKNPEELHKLTASEVFFGIPCRLCGPKTGAAIEYGEYSLLHGPIFIPRPDEPGIPPPSTVPPEFPGLESEFWTIAPNETNQRIEILDSEGVRIALVTGVTRAENAPLIRSAPDLLKSALKFQEALRGFFLRHDPRTPPYTELSKALEFAERAIEYSKVRP